MPKEAKQHARALNILKAARLDAVRAANSTAGSERKGLRRLSATINRLILAGGPCKNCGVWHPQPTSVERAKREQSPKGAKQSGAPSASEVDGEHWPITWN